MILVVGASGSVGSEVCNLLSAKGKRVRALSRSSADSSKSEKLKQLGVELVTGDLKSPESLTGPCSGVQTVISTASSTHSRQTGDTIESVDLKGQLNLIDAAGRTGVSHFVYVSFSGKIDADFPLRNAKRTVENHLKKSGLRYTILRPTFFTEVWLSPAVGFDFANAKAQIYGEGHNKISWISYLDVARFAVAVLDESAAANSTIELGGPEALSPLEVVRIFEETSGRKFDLQYVPENALLAQMASAEDSLHRSFTALMLAYAAGDVIDMTETLKKFPMKLTSVRDYAKKVVTG